MWKRFQPALDYRHRECDRILLSYPRSGLNWVQYIIQLILSDGQRQDKHNMTDYWLEHNVGDILARQQHRDITVLATHLPANRLPINDKARYLLILRNPKDVLVSLYYFSMDIQLIPEFINNTKVKNSWYFGSYFQWVRDYWQLSQGLANNFQVLLYEDMIQEPRKAIKTIAKFLGDNYFSRLLSHSVNPNETLLDLIERLSSMDAMKNTYKNDGRIRTGIVGDWINHLTDEQSLTIDKAIDDQWMGTGLEGRNFCKIISHQCVEWAMDYEHRECDRIQVAYPRSGSNWIGYIIRLLKSDGQQSDSIVNNSIRLERSGKQVIDSQLGDDFCHIMTHLTTDSMAINPKARYLFSLRNPKDVVCSEYKYISDNGWLPEDGDVHDVHDFFRLCFIEHKYPLYYGDYFQFVRQYWQLRDAQNFHVLLYEDMVRDPRLAIETVAKFLGDKYVRKLSDVMVSPEGNHEILLDRIVRLSSIGAMRGTYAGDPRIQTGLVGNWRSQLTKQESDLIDQKVATEWTGTGLELLWKQEMKWY
ncbi:uncharacterized protein LOC128956742 [Oppia nitens]|uniref:uncharacterized protein LOC128956742 n=1 Tax=Oppia nitens TaxID=1686743 RepID=UPI0023D9F137|nr:uncharacterized protein LOC128956742 [Oppia nitens]